MPTATELEAAIVRDPDDLELRRVYSDALQQAGDPRGEHLALAFSAAAGDLQAGVKVRTIERAASARLRQRLDATHVVRLHWHLGFVTHVDLDKRASSDKFPRTRLRELISQRELITLRGLDLRGLWNTEWSAERQLGLLPALVERRPVCWLGIGGGEITGPLITQLRTAIPALTGLGVLTSKPRSAVTGLVGLRDVELAAKQLRSTKLLTLVFEALAPDLERLVLHGMDERITADAFAPIFRREVFPKLRHLGVFGPHGLTWDLLRALHDSPFTDELKSLGFRAAELWDDDESETWIKEHGKRFKQVRMFTSALWPDDDTAHESGRLGLILKNVQRSVEAVPELEHHLQYSGADPDHFGCWEELAEAMVWAGWPEEALAPLEVGIRLFHNKVESDSIYTYRTRIEALDALDRHEEARETCVRALAYDDDNSWTHRHHGCALRELGRHDEALEAFTLAIKCAEYEDDDELNVLGWAYVEQGRTLWEVRRYDDALATFAKARLRGDRTAKRAGWWAEGALRTQRGEHDRACSCHERACELVAPGDLDTPFYEYGELLFELGRHEEALAVWKRGVEMFPSWVDLDEQGHALLALGRPTEALAVTEASRRNSGSTRAVILHALGRTGEAIVAVDDLAHRPAMPEAVCAARHATGRLLGAAFHRAAGREAEARELLEKVLMPSHDPRALHAELAAELGGAPRCHHDLCGRAAAVAMIAAAVALGDRAQAEARVAALGAAIDAGSARLMTMRIWDVHGALPLLGGDRTLVEQAASAAENGTSARLR